MFQQSGSKAEPSGHIWVEDEGVDSLGPAHRPVVEEFGWKR